MKTHNLNLKALILVLVLTITGQSFANYQYDGANEKKVIKINMEAPIIKLITTTLEVSQEDLAILESELNEAVIVLINNESPDFEFTLTGLDEPEGLFIVESNPEVPMIEDWMMEDDYLYTEAEPVIEDWMFEDTYLNAEAAPVIEDWMYSEDYLSTEASPSIEDWMMVDNHYIHTECCPKIEDWMMDDDYLSNEDIPEIEDWMMEGLLSD